MQENSDIFIGVIIPVYNKANFLRETLLSLTRQTYRNFQVIIVDDGSTDQISEVYDEFKNDERFHLIKNESNLGESAAVNIGWSFLETKYVAILSSDDPQLPEWIEIMWFFARTNPGYVTYYPDLMIIDDQSIQIGIVSLPEWSVELVRERLICVASAGSLHDKSMFPQGFIPRDPRVTYPSDLIQYLRFTLYGGSIKVPGIFGVWRKSDYSLTAQLTGHFKAVELNRSVRNWYFQNHELVSEVNSSRMEANLLGQTWKLVQREAGRCRAVKLTLETFGWYWFLNPRNQLALVKAIHEKSLELKKPNQIIG